MPSPKPSPPPSKASQRLGPPTKPAANANAATPAESTKPDRKLEAKPQAAAQAKALAVSALSRPSRVPPPSPSPAGSRAKQPRAVVQYGMAADQPTAGTATPFIYTGAGLTYNGQVMVAAALGQPLLLSNSSSVAAGQDTLVFRAAPAMTDPTNNGEIWCMAASDGCGAWGVVAAWHMQRFAVPG